MKRNIVFLSLLCVCAAGTNYIRAQIVLPKIIGNNMVLQRAQSVPVWGWARAGDKVTVIFAGQKKTAIANASGEWYLLLDAMTASAVPRDMTITTATEKVSLHNILVGEVWLCSGQSNMEFTMRKISKLQPPAGENWPVKELETAHNKSIRIFLSERKKMNPDPDHKGWSVAEDSALRSFTAVGYFFAKELYAKLKVPVGVISAAIPGSRIEPWIPEEAMQQQTFFKENTGKEIGKIDGDPGKFYEPMIKPLIPFAIKGFLWYQGESNCFLNERIQYSYKMKALIAYWRKQWNNKELPFYYVQIAPYYYSKATDRPYTVYSEPEFWEAQAAVLKMNNTAMIATVDLNNNPADLHPVNKWEVGKRLARAALSAAYRIGHEAPMGPIFESMSKKGSHIIINFSNTGRGLIANDNKPLRCFEIAGKDGVYVPANAVHHNNTIIVSAEKIKNPVSVRFAWREDAKPNLYNSDGLPAISFRTDNPVINNFN
ncbi:MAG: sialate O-acetylesterase [Niabella sp.]